MGRPKTPTQLKVVRGTTRADRANKREPKVEEPLPADPPEWLSPAALPWWGRVRPILTGMKVATSADPIAVGLLCDALAEYMAARDEALAAGMIYETTGKSGDTMIRAHPAVGIAADAWRRAKLMATEFGLTPASRAKVSVADAGPADPLAEWERGTGS